MTESITKNTAEIEYIKKLELEIEALKYFNYKAFKEIDYIKKMSSEPNTVKKVAKKSGKKKTKLVDGGEPEEVKSSVEEETKTEEEKLEPYDGTYDVKKIGGISVGKLAIFRDMYRETKKAACPEEFLDGNGKLKADIKEEYIQFLKS